MGGLLISRLSTPPTDSSEEAQSTIALSSRDMSVYVKAVGSGERSTDVVGKVFVQDDATGRTEFLFDLGAGCLPTWLLDAQAGYNLMIVEDIEIENTPLDQLMKQGALRYQFVINSDLQITKTLGIRSATLLFDDQVLRLNQQCS